MVEKNLSEILGGEVTIKSISLDLLSGLEIEGVSIGGKSGLLKIEKVFFYYSPADLLKGRMVINKMGADRPTVFLERREGRWNFEKYLSAATTTPKKKEQAPLVSKEPLLPPLPIPVNLQSFAVTDLHLRVKDDAYDMTWEGLDITAAIALSGRDIDIDVKITDNAKESLPSIIKARALPADSSTKALPVSFSVVPEIRLQLLGDSPENMKLLGSVRLNDLSCDYGENKIITNAGISLDMDLDPIGGTVKINRVKGDFLEHNRFSLSGKISDLFTQPVLSLSLQEFLIQLDSFHPVLKAVYPALNASGTINISAPDVHASLDEAGGFKAALTGRATLKKISMEENILGISVGGIDGDFLLEKVEADSTGTAAGFVSMNVRVEQGVYAENRLGDLSCTLASTSFSIMKGNLSSLKGTFLTALESASAGDVKLNGLENRIDFHAEDQDQGSARITSSIKKIEYALPDNSKIFTSLMTDFQIDLEGEKYNKVKIHGSVGLPDINVRLPSLKKTLSVSMKTEISADLNKQKVTLHSLDLDLPGTHGLNVKGSASLQEKAALDLETNGMILMNALSPILAGFVPDTKIGGRLELNKVRLSVEASPDLERFTAKGEGSLKMKNIRASYGKEIFLEGLGGGVQWEVSGINEKGIENAHGDVEAAIRFKEAGASGITLKESDTRVRASVKMQGVEMDIGFNTKETAYTIPEQGRIHFPFKVEGKITGNIEKGNVEVRSLAWSMGDTMRGETKVTVKSLGEGGFDLRNKVSLDMKNLLQKTGIREISQALEDIEIQGNMENVTSLRGKLKKSELHNVQMKSESKLSGGTLFYKPPDLSLNEFHMNSLLNVNYSGGKASLDGKMGFHSTGFSSPSENWKSPPLDLSTSLQAESDIQKGFYKLKNLLCSVKNLVHISANGKFEGPQSSFDAHVEIQKLNLRRLTKLLPPVILKALPKFEAEGEINVGLDAGGNIPDEKRLAQFPKNPLPLSVNFRVDVNKAGFHLPKLGLEVSDAGGPVSLNYGKNGLGLASRISIGSINYKSMVPEPFSLYTDTDIQLDIPDRIKISKLNFSLPEFGFEESVKGELKGLSPFIVGGLEPTLKNILEGVSCLVDAKISMDFPDPLNVWKGVETEGKAGLDLLFRLEPEKELALEGKVKLKKFGVKYEELAALKNLNVELPFAKKIFLDGKKKAEWKALQKTRKGVDKLYRGLFSYLPNKEKVTLELVRAMGYEISGIQVEPSFGKDSISLDRFSFKTLGGYVVGRLMAGQDNGDQKIKVGLEFAGIDTNLLVKKAPDEKAVINGNMSMEIPLPQSDAPEGLDIGALDVEVNITKIGEEMLDRLLLFVDPKESNPSIVDLRSKLKMATPVSARVKLKHGALSVSTRLKLLVIGGGILNIDALERVPIARLSGFGKINGLMVNVQDISRALNLLFAEDLKVKENGEISLGRTVLVEPTEPKQKVQDESG